VGQEWRARRRGVAALDVAVGEKTTEDATNMCGRSPGGNAELLKFPVTYHLRETIFLLQ